MKNFLLVMAIILFSGAYSLQAVELIYRDARGHFYYRCNITSGARIEIVRKSKGIIIRGGGKTIQFMHETLPAGHLLGVRDMTYFARIGCGEIGMPYAK